mgnify:CR=1 FL=1
MPVKKTFLKGKPVCKATFLMPKQAVANAGSVALVGDFNDWKSDATPMKRQRNGDYKVTVSLEPGRVYRYKYLIDDSMWENDRQAERYEPAPIPGVENSVISTNQPSQPRRKGGRK